MSLEELLTDTLHAADGYDASPDLFAKVQRSIEEDRAHRHRVRAVISWLALGALVITGYVLAAIRTDNGQVDMSYTSLEVLVTTVMVVVVVVMGPAIRRFGRTYERAVFAGSPETGTQVLTLLDIAYYLIFGGYIVMSLMFEPPQDLAWPDREFSDMLVFEAVRLGGLLLLMGVLHVALLIALPVVGLVHSANLRRARIAAGATSEDPTAVKVDRGIGVGVWIVAAVVVLQLVIGLIGVLVGIGAGG